jgi:hypothetical protein
MLKYSNTTGKMQQQLILNDIISGTFLSTQKVGRQTFVFFFNLTKKIILNYSTKI